VLLGTTTLVSLTTTGLLTTGFTLVQQRDFLTSADLPNTFSSGTLASPADMWKSKAGMVSRGTHTVASGQDLTLFGLRPIPGLTGCRNTWKDGTTFSVTDMSSGRGTRKCMLHFTPKSGTGVASSCKDSTRKRAAGLNLPPFVFLLEQCHEANASNRACLSKGCCLSRLSATSAICLTRCLDRPRRLPISS